MNAPPPLRIARLAAPLALSFLAVACSDTDSGVGGRPDAPALSDTAPDTLGDAAPDTPGDAAPDTPDDAAPDATLDAAFDVTTDALADAADDEVAVDVGPARCASNADCAGDPAGAACDTASGRCVQCVAAADTCDPAQHCDPASNTCAAGCRSDEGCAPDGGVPRRCDLATHACVECVRDEHCAAGSLCLGGVCAPGCNAGRACPADQACCAGACVDAQRNVAHCGACDRACTAPNATPACLSGACAVGACTAPFADCDGAAANGCEANTQADAAHCGGCGMACAARPNAAASCAAGRCAYACDAGFADCDGDPANGCEADTRTSTTHCGACGRACPAAANAAPVCAAGACGFACNAGFGDCDGDAANGCETDLSTSAASCGRCGSACPSGVCAGGACQAPSCSDRVTNGSETDVDCGGSCPGCDLCRACRAASDCVAGTCNAAGRCTFRAEVYVDWLTTCHAPDNTPVDVVVPGVPAGSYQITALSSGGIVWSAVSLPGQGWSWRIPCENLAAPTLATPGGVYYATPEEAFAALPTTTATASFAGGSLRCYFTDSACRDNRGGTRFRMERACP